MAGISQEEQARWALAQEIYGRLSVTGAMDPLNDRHIGSRS
jgi:hypothetical protein